MYVYTHVCMGPKCITEPIQFDQICNFCVRPEGPMGLKSIYCHLLWYSFLFGAEPAKYN